MKHTNCIKNNHLKNCITCSTSKSAAGLVVLATMLAGCGQKGALYLPNNTSQSHNYQNHNYQSNMPNHAQQTNGNATNDTKSNTTNNATNQTHDTTQKDAQQITEDIADF